MFTVTVNTKKGKIKVKGKNHELVRVYLYPILKIPVGVPLIVSEKEFEGAKKIVKTNDSISGSMFTRYCTRKGSIHNIAFCSDLLYKSFGNNIPDIIYFKRKENVKSNS